MNREALAALDGMAESTETWVVGAPRMENNVFTIRRKVAADKARISQEALFRAVGKVFYTEGSSRCWQMLSFCANRQRQGGVWSVVIYIQQVPQSIHSLPPAVLYGTTTLHAILAAVA